MEYTHTSEDRTVANLPERDQYGVPNKHFPTQTGLNIRHTSEPIGKNTQIALGAQKRSLPGAHRWTYLVLELVSSS